MKKNILIFWVSIAFISGLYAQNSISGKVISATDGLGIPGVNISLKSDSSVGTSTDIDGNYTLIVPASDVILVFSAVGMRTLELPLSQAQNVIMREDTQMLDEVVVTALGIKRSEKSLSYATQKINAKEITEVPSSNVLSNLAGKTAGMMVSNSGAGVGSSVKVVLRGNRSIFGNNQPLYIVDGTPINSASFTDGANADGGFGGSIDAGDGLAGINPNDIESINVLKGASAAALYGSQAANGVIMITTKRGKSGRTSVNFQTSFQADIPYMTYEFQDRYEMGTGGISQNSNLQWGKKNTTEKLSNDFIEDFFKTGNLYTNAIAISGGNEHTQNYVSYQNTSGKGIMPKNTFDKHNVAIRSTTSLFDNFVTVDGSVALMKQDIDHAPSAPGRYFNPIVGLYLFPEGNDEFDKYKNEFEIFASEKNIMKSNWRSSDQGINQNPYWLLNRYSYDYKVKKAIAKLNLTFNLTEYLNLKVRGSYDYTQAESERRVNWGVEVITGEQGGRYEVYNDNFTESYTDALLNFNKSYGNFDIIATLGTSISNKKTEKQGTRVNLRIPNFFNLNNYVGRPINREKKEHRQLQSVFGTVSIGWENMLYLDMTARNDWASTLPAGNRSYFYPSLGTSFIFTEWLNQNNNRPDWLSFGKFRISWTQVGNDMPWGKTIVYDSLNDSGDVQKNTIAPFKDLKPEKSIAFETGLNTRMFDNRLTLDLAYYQTDTENQYFLVDAPSGTGYSRYYINAGKIRNKGWEATLGFEPFRGDFSWNSSLNFTTNKNTIISLPEQYKETGLKLTGGGFTYLLKEGEEWGEMYMRRAKHDKEGRLIVVDSNGKIQLQDAKEESRIGNVNPDFMLGWSNQLKYKNFALDFQIDGRFGGKVISSTQAFLNKYGRSQESADARDAGGIFVKAATENGQPYTKPIDAQIYYNSKEGYLAMYKATNLRLRELSLSYNLPASVLAPLKVITGARIALIGRNLLYIYRDAPFDPEMVLSTTTNSTSNVDNFSIPMSRSFGISLNVNF